MDINAIKRLAAFIIGLLAIALNKKLGLELDATAQAAIVSLVVWFIGQSAWKEVKLGGTMPDAPESAPASDADAAKIVAGVK